jgi:hypothetical protein
MIKRVSKAAEVESMTPTQRHDLFVASVVRDLEHAPAELLARTRAKIEVFIAANEDANPV